VKKVWKVLLIILILLFIFFLLFFTHANILLFYLYSIFFIVFLLLIVSAIWPPESPWAPWWRTDNKTARAIIVFGKIGKGSVVYDLGCGDGEVLIESAKKGAKGVGIEIDPLRFWVSKIRAKKNGLSDKLIFKRGSFHDYDISEANVVIVYLIPKTLDRLLPKFKKELKKGTKIISYRYEMKMKPTRFDKKNNLFLYTI
jgi:SAM-dependent methyltransferase